MSNIAFPVKTTKNKAYALKLLEYFSSENAQNFYASANKEYPVTQNAQAHESIIEWGIFSEYTINLSKLCSLQKQAVFLAQDVGNNYYYLNFFATRSNFF